MRVDCSVKRTACFTLLLLMVLFHRGCTENYLELEDLNDNRDLVESCPTTACEARGNSSCIGMNYSSCSDILCVDACGSANFIESKVFCQEKSACATAQFESSRVTCNESQACFGAMFISSAIECQTSNGILCDGIISLHCNCCSDPWWACPIGVPSCFDDECSDEGPTDIFCASTFLGRTCKDWGNPVCTNSAVESLPPIHPADGCSAGEEIVECGFSQSCSDAEFSSCSVNCLNSQDCYYSLFDQSTVACQAPSSCAESKFTDSEVTCTGVESCAYTNSFKSTVHCNVSDSCVSVSFVNSVVDCQKEGACQDINWNLCSCCLTPGKCPLGMARCPDADGASLDDFCSSTFLGRTCKDWGNPLCATSNIASPTPLHPASNCSENVDVVECLGDCWLTSDTSAINSCSVFCVSDCDSFSFDNSSVYCYSWCDYATFRGSEVECSNYGCTYANFKSSAVNCSNVESCSGASLDECSCCMNSDNDNCLDEGDLCFDDTGSTDEFCSKIYSNQKCLKAPNPICKDYKPRTPATLNLTAPMDTPVNIEAPYSGDVAVINLKKPPTNGRLTIQPNNTVTYTPNPGFVGIDEFIVEFCYTDARCDTVNVVVDVKSEPIADNEENDSSKGLYALSVLALIPLIVGAVFVRKRYIQNRHHDSETVKKPSDHPADPDLPPTSPPDPMEPSPDPSALHSTTHAVIGQDVTTTAESSDDTASRQSSKGGRSARGKGQCPPGIESHMLSNKDQCRTHAEESREVPVADAVPAEY